MHRTAVHDPYLQLAVAEGFGESPVPALLQPDLDPMSVLTAPPSPPDVPLRVAERLRQPDLAATAAAVQKRARAHGLLVLTPDHPEWPPQLTNAPLRPLVLVVRGDPAALRRQPSVAVVGSRTPTPYGSEAATLLCSALARAGPVTWSGLARGIDGIAHGQNVTAKVPTVAVLAGGLDAIYPPEHQELAARIVATGGALVSELPPGQRARRGHFVRRNRILAVGAQAVVVVEASLSSGALHTARFAAEAGPDVFAVPGPWTSERSQGCHRLLTEGAHVVESPEALLQALGLLLAPDADVGANHGLQCSAEQQRLLDLLRHGPRPGDLLARESGLERAAFLRALMALERDGVVVRGAGDLWSRGSGRTG